MAQPRGTHRRNAAVAAIATAPVRALPAFRLAVSLSALALGLLLLRLSGPWTV